MLNIKRRNFLLAIFAIAGCFYTRANDSSYCVSGNHLVPLTQNQISVVSEILTMEFSDSEYINVDVFYKFRNDGDQTTVLMGFEAIAPDCKEQILYSPQGIHPFISDFNIVMNGQQLPYMNSIVHRIHGVGNDNDFKKIENIDILADPLNLPDECPSVNLDIFYNSENNEVIHFSYAYTFDAIFEPGINVIRHSYKYHKSYGVGYAFYYPYLLTPALGWANGQIDEFTLRISAPETAKHFMLNAIPFDGCQIDIVSGQGKFRKVDIGTRSKTSYIEVSLRNGTIQLQSKNFKPSEELEIYSADRNCSLRQMHEEYSSGKLYDRTVPYPIDVASLTDKEKRILRNVPYANRGYIFKSAELREYFNSIWWYMPNPNWKLDTKDFTPQEHNLLRRITSDTTH